MTGLSRQGNVLQLSEVRVLRNENAIVTAALASVGGDQDDMTPARALVAVSIYPNGDIRHTVSMVQPEDVQTMIGAMLDVIDKMVEFRDQPIPS